MLSDHFIARVMQCLCHALIEMRERGVVHCDVKPANVLIRMVRDRDGLIDEIRDYADWYTRTYGSSNGNVSSNDCTGNGNINNDNDSGNDTISNINNNDCTTTITTINSTISNNNNNIDSTICNGDSTLVFKLADYNISTFIDRPVMHDGTPRYMPPESLSGTYDYSSDLYSLILMWVEMKTGIELPVHGRVDMADIDMGNERDNAVVRRFMGRKEDRMSVYDVLSHFE